MLVTVLKSAQATEVTISIMRTFTKLRHYALEHSDLSIHIHKLHQEMLQNKQWTKDRMSAVTDAIIILEESFDALKEMVSEIGASKEVEAITVFLSSFSLFPTHTVIPYHDTESIP